MLAERSGIRQIPRQQLSLIHIWNIIKSFALFVRIRPDVVITTGTHTAVPMCFIAHFFKKKVIWIETFANSTTQTEAGKLVYPIADLDVYKRQLRY